MTISIVKKDCIEYMRGISDDFFDFVFFDPPYNKGKQYDNYDDNLPDEEYKLWMGDVITEVRRVTRGKFAVYVGGTLWHLFSSLMPDSHPVPIHKRAIGPRSGNWFLQYHILFCVGTPLKLTKDLWDNIRLPGEGYFFTEERYDHPGMTGLVMTKRIIDTFTHKHSVVFDPFCGTGTTAVACVEMDRNFIGCDISQKYCKIAKDRVARAQSQLILNI